MLSNPLNRPELFPSIVFVIVFVLAIVGLWLGLQVAARLPKHHLQSEARASANIGISIVATLAALVLGLMITSAKRSFDEREAEIVQVSTSIVLLDRALAGLGDGSTRARAELRALLDQIAHLANPEGYVLAAAFRSPGNNLRALTHLQETILAIAPESAAQTWFRQRALQLTSEIALQRVLTAERGDRTIPGALLVVVTLWVVLIYIGLGVFSVGNPSVIVAFVLCALAFAGSEFLILELDTPYSGFIGISSAPLLQAKAILGT